MPSSLPTDGAAATLVGIYRYPVKGLTGEPLEAVDLSAGEGLPWDRHFAIAHGESRFDPARPAWQSKREFLQLARDERLALLGVAFDAASGVLTIRRNGRVACAADITDPAGRKQADAFLAGYMADDPRGRPVLVSAPGAMFTDSREKFVSLINRTSLRDLASAAGAALDERRFRGNLMIESARPWEELDWVGRELRVGAARLEVVARIERCAATTVNPDTAERDINVPKLLQKTYGHVDCGVYARVVSGGRIGRGDALALSEDPPADQAAAP